MMRLPPDMAEAFKRVLSEPPERADAVVWLQGDRFDRGQKTLALYRQGWAPRIVLTGNNALVGRGPRPGEENVPITEMRSWLLEHGVPEGDLVIDDASFNTGDQAEHVIGTAVQQDWRTILLVANPYHQLRAYLTFLKRAKEAGWAGRIVNQPVAQAWEAVPSGRDRTNEELFAEEMGKIRKYALV